LKCWLTGIKEAVVWKQTPIEILTAVPRENCSSSCIKVSSHYYVNREV